MNAENAGDPLNNPQPFNNSNINNIGTDGSPGCLASKTSEERRMPGMTIFPINNKVVDPPPLEILSG